MNVAALLCILVLCVSVSNGLPNHWSEYFRNKLERVHLQQANSVCEAAVQTPASLACQSAKVTVTGNHIHVHICPDNDGTASDICYNSKLPRCCPTDVTRGLLKCVSATKLTVTGQKMTVNIYEASATSGHTHCIHFDANIESCCRAQNKVLDCQDPEPAKCVPKRDVFFVLDATQSIGDDMFCRFGYVLQLIEAAINPRGIDGARVATVLFENNQNNIKSDYLFNLDDRCDTVVSTNIPRVVYEYYAVHNNLPHGRLTYPQVDSRSTTPFSALVKVEESINRNRNTSIIILTDGKPQQNIPSTGIINDLSKISDVIIAAGIGSREDIDKAALGDLVTDPNNVVYEPDTGKVIDFARRIVERMERTGALCPTEASSVLTALRNTDVGDTIKNYCQNCMWTLTPAAGCGFPRCGAQNLEMQATANLWLHPEANADNLLAMEMEKQILQEEIVAEIQEMMGKISRG